MFFGEDLQPFADKLGGINTNLKVNTSIRINRLIWVNKQINYEENIYS